VILSLFLPGRQSGVSQRPFHQLRSISAIEGSAAGYGPLVMNGCRVNLLSFLFFFQQGIFSSHPQYIC
jgi:hypothetical protein